MVSRRLPRSVLLPSLVLALLALLPSCSEDQPEEPDGPGGTISPVLLKNVLANEIAGMRGALTLPGGPPGCLEISPWPPADEDEDGVPDAARFDYDRAGCTVGGGDFSLSWWGSILTQDPGAPFGYTAEIPAMSYEESGGGQPRTVTRTISGTRTVGGRPTQVVLSTALTMEITSSDGATAAAEASWMATFMPATGDTVGFGLGMPYPAGTIEVEGVIEWSQGGAVYSFSLVTIAPLQNDPDCASPFAVGGEIQARVISGGDPGYLRMRCTGCGTEIEFDWVPGD